MIKVFISSCLVLIGLLIPIIAYTNPNSYFTLSVVPTGTPPGPALAAGFTTLAIDYDFTQTTPWSDKSQWLRCHDGSGAASPLFWIDWIGFGGWTMPFCNDTNIKQRTDPLGGTALNIHMDKATLTSMGCEPDCDTNQFMIRIPLQTGDSSGVGNQVPSNAYVEVTALVVPSNPAMFHNSADFWSLGVATSIEWDGIEWYGSNNGGTTLHNNETGRVISTNNFNVLDSTAYHKYAWRVTMGPSPTPTDGYFCSYTDDQPANSSPGNCVTWLPNGTQLSSQFNQVVQFLPGFAGCNGADGSGSTFCPNGSVDMWIKSLKVWSCGGINSGAHCLSTTANP